MKPLEGRKRVIIEEITPQVDCGRYPAKRILGDAVTVTAAVFGDGHDHVSGRLLYRPASESDWRSTPLTPLTNDLWSATFTVDQLGGWSYTIEAWIDHFDAREQNSMDSWIADAGKKGAPDSSPGYVRHYYLDTSDSLGSEWDWDGVSRRMSHSYLLDWGDIGYDFVTLGIPTRPWERTERTKGHEKFGYFDLATFVPEDWKNEYPNPAFSRMTERDGAWMTRILARFTPEMVNALAEIGKFSNPSDTAYIGNLLNARLEKILARYLTRLSPLTDVRVENGNQLCALDLARYRHVRSAEQFQYSAQLAAGSNLPVVPRTDNSVCVTLPQGGLAASLRDDAPERYLMVSISNGVAPGPLLVHLYDLGAVRGFRVVGLERPEAAR